jgi:hypothetical protein
LVLVSCLSYGAGFYKLTILKSPPFHLQDYSTYNNVRLVETFHYRFLYHAVDSNELRMRNVLSSMEVRTQNLLILTTRLWLLAEKLCLTT